jgi:hypothetical protein
VQAFAAKTVVEIGTSIHGIGPANKLEAGKKILTVASIFIAGGLLFSFVGAAIFFIPASWGVLKDIK